MFRLPVCPHCGTVYRYGDTKRAQKQKNCTCYHCRRQFRAKLLPGTAAEALILLPLCVGFNILLLTRMRELNLFALFGATFVFIILYILLMPFFVRFEKNAESTGHPPDSGRSRRQNTADHNKHKSSLSNNQPKKQLNQKKRRS